MSLFNLREMVLHSGDKSDWIVDCDALTDDDLAALAKVMSRLLPPFDSVIGVPKGGLRFAAALGRYAGCVVGVPRLVICDDVLTTGNSMEELRARHATHLAPATGEATYGANGWVYGAVIFARRPCPSWVTPIWSLHGQT